MNKKKVLLVCSIVLVLLAIGVSAGMFFASGSKLTPEEQHAIAVLNAEKEAQEARARADESAAEAKRFLNKCKQMSPEEITDPIKEKLMALHRKALDDSKDAAQKVLKAGMLKAMPKHMIQSEYSDK